LLRITGGRFRGRKLAPLAGRDVRPSPSRLRQAVFDVLQDVEGTRVLDLFCGAGTFGLEALSRGAAHAFFVDRSHRSLSVVRRNVALLGIEDAATIVRADALAAAARIEPLAQGADLAWLDPPYALFRTPRDRAAIERLLEGLAANGGSGGPACLAVEHPAREDPPLAPHGYEAAAPRRFGESAVTFFDRTSGPNETADTDPAGR